MENTTDQIDVVHRETKKPLQSRDTTQQERPEPEEAPVKEYNEVLYAQVTPTKKLSLSTQPKKESVQRTSWENPCTIEHSVDRIGMKKEETVASNPQISDQIEKKVDRLIAKKKLER
jgi:hypothetical protein